MRIPPLIRCPICEPCAISYAGTVINEVCDRCKADVKRQRQERRPMTPRVDLEEDK